MKTALQEIIMRLESANENVPSEAFEYALKVCNAFLPVERQQLENAWVSNDVAADATEFNYYFATTYDQA